MSNASRIFVALDASDGASLVLAAATKFVDLSGGKLVLFRAVGIPPDLPQSILEMTNSRVEESLLKHARKDLELLAKQAEGRVEKIHAVLGTTWDAICREAKEVGADLIVIGSHGHSRLARMLGTTAAKVVNNAELNVLVVRTQL